jgi:hypothetical protein
MPSIFTSFLSSATSLESSVFALLLHEIIPNETMEIKPMIKKLILIFHVFDDLVLDYLTIQRCDSS